MIKYRTTTSWEKTIDRVEIERETDKCVFIDGRRCGKMTDYESYFDTWDQAYLSLISKAEKVVAGAASRLRHAREELEKIKALEANDD